MVINERFSIVKKIFETKDNILYQVIDKKSNETLAIKSLKVTDSHTIRRFKKEYYILHTLLHPNIVKVFDLEIWKKKDGNHFYFSMEYIDGIPIHQYFRKGKLDQLESFFQEILHTLAFIHQKGILHCDLKPHNILITEKGNVKFVDFGFAQLQKEDLFEDIGGTLRYIAPEILKGEKPDIRSEIYSLGLILYESLTGEDTFVEKTVRETIESIIKKPLPRIKPKKGVPQYLIPIIMKMIDKSRMNRYPNIKSIIETLENKGNISDKKEHIERVLYSDFIGREDYLEISSHKLKRSIEGNGQILFVEGLTGIGKTRLLKEIEHRFFIEGKEVNYTRITNIEKENFAWLIKLLERIGVSIQPLKRFHDDEKFLITGSRRFDFFERVKQLLKKVTDKKPQVIIVDDIDIQNKNVREFLLYISHFIAHNRIMLICATERIPENVRDTIVKGDYRNIHILSLLGLSSKEIIPFTKNLLGVNENVEVLASFLFKKTEGNPFFIEELLKELVERKLLLKSGRNLIYKKSDINSIPIPKNVESFVQERIKKLPKEEKGILELTAVFGDSIPVSWLYRLSSYKEPKIIRIAENLLLSQFFSLFDNCYDFTHKILREIIYREIPEKNRISLHKKIYDYLKSMKETPFILQQKAYHAFNASLPSAKDYLLKILTKAIRSNDIENAIESYEKLHTIIGNKIYSELNIDSLIKIGNFHTQIGEYEKSTTFFSHLLSTAAKKVEKVKISHSLAVVKTISGKYKEAEQIFNRISRSAKETDRKFEILIDKGWLAFSQGDHKKAERTYEKAIGISPKVKNKILLARLYYNLGVLNQYGGAEDKAENYAKKALEISTQYHSPFFKNAALNLLARIEQRLRGFKSALPHYKRALRDAEKSKDFVRMLNVLLGYTKCLYLSGEWGPCEEYLFTSLDLAKQLGALYEIAYLFNLLGNLNYRFGNMDFAGELYDKSYDIGKLLHNDIIQFCNLIDLAKLSSFQGKVSHYERNLNGAKQFRKRIKEKNELAKIDLVEGIHHYHTGKYEQSVKILDKFISQAESTSLLESQIQSLIYRTRSLLELKREKETLSSLQKGTQFLEKWNLFLYKDEIELLKIVVKRRIEKQSVTGSMKRFLNKKKVKKQHPLYAETLILQSDIDLEEYRNTNKRAFFYSSLERIKRAKKLSQKMGASFILLKIESVANILIDDFPLEQDKTIGGERYLETLTELGEAIRNISYIDTLKERFITLAKKITGAERGLFLTFDPETDDFSITGEDIDKATINDAKRISRSVIQEVKTTKRAVISGDAIQDKRFGKNESVLINEIRSLLCIPIISDERVFGTLYLDSRTKPDLFSQKDKKFFGALANLLASTLTKALDYKKIEEETIFLKKRLRTRFGPKNIIGKSEKMQEVFDKATNAASIDIPVLITGETGTGKELLAETIHHLSERKDRVFSVIDCLAIPATLLESELFGYTKGAFTGAEKEKDGLLESSENGTIFIDEIGDASGGVQSSLLRFLDTGEIKKIGATKYKKVNTRIIAATNKDLLELVSVGQFREDLYYRLNKFIIHLPPLRQRGEDIKILIDHYIERFNKKYNKKIKGLTKTAFTLLINYDWPGNIRELESEIERAILTCDTHLITENLLSPQISKLPTRFLSLKEMEEISRLKYIQNVLSNTGRNVSRAAEILQIDRRTIQRILKEGDKKK